MTSSQSVQYAELNEVEYTAFHKKLIAEKERGGEFQREFLTALKDNARFVECVRENAPRIAGEPASTIPGALLTEQSFKDPPKNVERMVYDRLKDIPPKTACRISFWAEVTLRHIEEGAIGKASWLAANGSMNEEGAERVEKALTQTGDARAKAMDDCVRTALRRMSGLRAERGSRSVFVDAPFARAWWRERIIARILERGDEVEGRAALTNVVRINQTYWERLIVMIVSRGSVLGSVNVQDAFINSLAKRFKEDGNTELRSANTLTSALRRFSAISAARELGALDFNEIGAVADELLARF